MALYTYQATDTNGKLARGTLEAADEKALIARLQEMGYLPIKVSVATGASEKPSALKPFGKKVSGRSLAEFTHELKSLLEAGLPIDRSLSILAELEPSGPLKAVILDIYKGLHGGRSLAESLEKHPDVFPEIYVSVVRAGEAGGVLEVMLGRLSKFMEETQKLKDDLKSALMYPLILTFAGGAAVLFMLLFVIPKFSVIFEDMGGAMPLPTLILLYLSNGLKNWWWLLGGSAIGAFFVLRARAKTESGKLWLDRLKIRAPIIGPVAHKAVISRFSRTLGTLLQGGIPVLEALKISIETMGNAAVVKEMAPVVDGVRRGRGIAVPLKEVPSFPPLASHMLTVGEETGRLDEMLLRLADNYDREISTSLKRLLSLLEPVIILLMAVVVGFIVISLLLAIFSINDMPL